MKEPGSYQRWYAWMLCIGIAAFIVDRVLKYLALHFLQQGVIIIPHIFHLEFLGNRNFLFYIEAPAVVMYLLIVSVMGLVIYFVVKELQQGNRLRVALMMFIFIGAFSNLIDRIEYGYVVDFISIPFWSVFNFADMYIVFGVLILLLDTWKHDTQHQTISTKN